jgi:pimeloyl-ACP methyl ester carboxylesterase
VLVHGAWADGSSWSQVGARLQDAGYIVRTPPNNLRGVNSDAADLRHFLDTIPGPVVLAGHSYGGFVITNAAKGSANVKALVYVDALIPTEGDTLFGLTHPPSIFAQDPADLFDLVPYSGAPADAVDTYVKPSVFGEAMANKGFTRRQIGVLYASQRPLSTAAFAQASGAPAWADIPSWAVVGKYDRIFPVADQIAMAQRAGARITKVDAPHMSMLTASRTIAEVILRAARAN